MDLKKTGEFIASRRKDKGLTQVQLAQMIAVSEKTISKWECGKGFPDASLMLPLCDALEISANELLSACILPNEKQYREKAENNLIELKSQREKSNKHLLTLEYVMGYMSILFLLVLVMIASYVKMADGWRIALIVIGFVNCIVGLGFCLQIEQEAGFYECAHCKHKYVPTYKAVLWSMHCGRTRYMKCPKCNKHSWQKKRINKD